MANSSLWTSAYMPVYMSVVVFLSICMLSQHEFAWVNLNYTATRWKAQKEPLLLFSKSNASTCLQRIHWQSPGCHSTFLACDSAHMRPRFPAAHDTMEYFSQTRAVLLDSSFLLRWMLKFQLFDTNHYNQRNHMQYNFRAVCNFGHAQGKAEERKA